MSEPDLHHLLLYEYVEDMADRRGPYREAHLARIRDGRQSGEIVMAGALGDPPAAGAIVFRGVPRERVEAWADADPYTEAGLITSRRIEVWSLV